MIAPAELHVMRLLDSSRAGTRGAPILIHCWAGISRSTAAALHHAVPPEPAGAEIDIAAEMRLRAATSSRTRCWSAMPTA